MGRAPPGLGSPWWDGDRRRRARGRARGRRARPTGGAGGRRGRARGRVGPARGRRAPATTPGLRRRCRGEGGGRSRVPERGAPPRWRAARARPPCAARGARWRAPAPACASAPSPRRRWTPSTRGRMGDGRFRDGFGSADPRDGTRVRACEGGTTASAIGMPTTVGRGGERDVRTTTRRAAGPSGTSNASRECEARAPRATGRPRRLRRLGARRSDGHRSRASERGNHRLDSETNAPCEPWRPCVSRPPVSPRR